MKVRSFTTDEPAQSFGSIAPIFRGPFLEKVALGRHASTFLELGDHYSSFNPPTTTAPLRDWFEFFYQLLFKRYRCEYVYKNTIATKIFLSRHSLQDSYMTDELRSGSSRADVSILNATSTIYEIKSEYDSFDRLSSQVEDYKKIFDLIYVVTTDEKAASLTDTIDLGIGVIAMREDGTLTTIRKAQSNKHNTVPAAIFDCMRQVEFCRATVDAFGLIPSVPNSQLYRTAKEMFCSIQPDRAHDLMVRQVKMRGKKQPFADLINNAPPSLKHACLSFTRPQAMAVKINQRLGEPLT